MISTKVCLHMQHTKNKIARSEEAFILPYSRKYCKVDVNVRLKMYACL